MKSKNTKSESKKILVIEDERPMARALDLKLTHEGFEVELAFNGEEGLDKLKSGKFDFVMMDLMMPRMDGFTLLSKMKEIKDMPPAVVLSNLGQPEDKSRVKELGAKEFFVKSNTPIGDIVKSVKKMLK